MLQVNIQKIHFWEADEEGLTYRLIWEKLSVAFHEPKLRGSTLTLVESLIFFRDFPFLEIVNSSWWDCFCEKIQSKAHRTHIFQSTFQTSLVSGKNQFENVCTATPLSSRYWANLCAMTAGYTSSWFTLVKAQNYLFKHCTEGSWVNVPETKLKQSSWMEWSSVIWTQWYPCKQSSFQEYFFDDICSGTSEMSVRDDSVLSSDIYACVFFYASLPAFLA